MDYKKSDLVKLSDGKIVKIVNLPSAFMANGCYEVVEWIDNGIGEIGKSFWVKPDDTMYPIKKEFIDDINKYFEVIWDDIGLNLIPKDLLNIEIESDREDFNRIRLNYQDGRKHSVVNIHIGDVTIGDKQEITVRPKKKKKSKIEKVIKIIKGEENEV